MSTNLLPPSTPVSPRARRAVSITVLVIGGVIVAGMAVGLAGKLTAAAAGGGDQQLTSSVAGVQQLDLTAQQGTLEVSFGDVAQAELNTTGAGPRWSMTRDGDSLEVTAAATGWSLFGGSNNQGDQRATLVLPEELRGADLTVEGRAGRQQIDGDFGEVDASLAAGELVLSGTAQSLEISLDAGRVQLDVADAETVAIDLQAGDVTGHLTGQAPATTTVSLLAGSVDLGMPDTAYRFIRNADLGMVSSTLRESDSADATLSVDVSFGSVRLRPE